MSPKDLSSSKQHNELIHITVSSAFVGFIDDMYMITEEVEIDGKTERVLSLQSQLRIGSYDFDQNYQHIKDMLDCLNNSLGGLPAIDKPCSQ